jgi:Domain of unknown function (DUF4062)
MQQKRKLQVFVSSTFIDLKEERQTAVQAILNAGHIPAGMELFTAGDESQWTIIKRWIEESDVYMLLLGGRYGSIEPKSGKSYTHLEYDYAVELGKPLFAIVTTDKALDEKVSKEGKKVLELDNPQGLKDFKKVVTSNMCAFWDDLKDIKLNVNDSIRDIEYRYANSLKGWVKADDTDYSSISEELARLSKENSELKSKLESQSINDTEEKIIAFLKENSVVGEYGKVGEYVIVTLFDYFITFAYSTIFSPKNKIGTQDLQLLRSLGLIETEAKKLSEKGKNVYLYIQINNIAKQDRSKIPPQEINWAPVGI